MPRTGKGSSLLKWGLAAGWLLLVVGAGVLGQEGIQAWERMEGEAARKEAQLRRLKGWLDLEEETEARLKELLGPLAGSTAAGLSWAVPQLFQRAAQQEGLAVVEMKPSPGPAGSFRMDAKVTGRLEQIGSLLARLPDAVAGVRLESLQMTPQGSGRIQLLLRFVVSAEAAGRRP